MSTEGAAMSDFAHQTLSNLKTARRRNVRTMEQKMKDSETILADIAAGKHSLETIRKLGLSPSQYNKHLVDALEAGDLISPPKVKDAIIRFSSLQPRDRKELNEKLQLAIHDSDLLKFEWRGNEIIFTIISGAEMSVIAGEGIDPNNIDEEENAHDQEK